MAHALERGRSSGIWSQGWAASPLFNCASYRPGELHGNECHIHVSPVTPTLVPRTLLGPCAWQFNARGELEVGGRSRGSGRWGSFGYWTRREACPFEISLCCNSFDFISSSSKLWMSYWVQILKQHVFEVTSLLAQFYIHQQEYTWCILWSSVSEYTKHPPWYTVPVNSRVSTFPPSFPQSFSSFIWSTEIWSCSKSNRKGP